MPEALRQSQARRSASAPECADIADITDFAGFVIRTMRIDDHPAFLALMRGTPGVRLRDVDAREASARYLLRNPGLSFLACLPDAARPGMPSGAVVGGIMAGHDGRRGYLQHLLVHPDHRRRGLARELVARSIGTLDALGIHKSHIDVLADNAAAFAFWRALGWQLRDDVQRLSFTSRGGPDA